MHMYYLPYASFPFHPIYRLSVNLNVPWLRERKRPTGAQGCVPRVGRSHLVLPTTHGICDTQKWMFHKLWTWNFVHKNSPKDADVAAPFLTLTSTCSLKKREASYCTSIPNLKIILQFHICLPLRILFKLKYIKDHAIKCCCDHPSDWWPSCPWCSWEMREAPPREKTATSWSLHRRAFYNNCEFMDRDGGYDMEQHG